MKKIFKLMGALLAGAMMFACSDQIDETIEFSTEISTNVTELAKFAAENAEAQTIEVTADGQWMAIAPAWLEVKPNVGYAGTTTVTVKALDNFEDVEKEDGTIASELGPQRSATITFTGEGEAKAQVAIEQDGDPNKWDPAKPRPVTMKYFNETAATGDGFIYELTGKITEVVNTLYGNFYIEDETGTAYIYGLLTPDGEAQKQWAAAGLKVNDVITVRGARGEYKGSPQMSNATYVSHESGEPSAIVDATIAEFLAAEKSGTQYRISGAVTSIAKAEYGNVYIKDATGEVYVYGIGQKGEFETMGIEVGDIVTLISNRGEYNGTPQAANSTLEKKVDVTPLDNIAAFLATEQNDTYYMISGTVSGVGAGGDYGNIYVEDETGKVYVYGLLSGWKGAKKEFPALVEATGLKDGDTLTLIGKHTSYNDVDQVGSAFYFSHESGEAPTNKVVTVAEITEAGNYKVEGVTVVATHSKGFLVADATGIIAVYLNAAHEYVVGDKMNVEGAVTIRYNMAQFGADATIEKTGNDSAFAQPEADVIDAAKLDAYIAAPVYKYVSVTGVLNAEQYINLVVEGTENTASVSNYADADALKALNGHNLTLCGYFAGSNAKSKYATIYVTSYTDNGAPDLGVLIGEGTEAFLKAIVDGSLLGDQTPAVDDWKHLDETFPGITIAEVNGKLEVTYISGAPFTALPNTIDLPELVEFKINGNKAFEGKNLPTVWNLPKAEVVNISECGFVGAIPASFAENTPAMHSLFMNHNNFAGAWPHNWASGVNGGTGKLECLISVNTPYEFDSNKGMGYMVPATLDVKLNNYVDGVASNPSRDLTQIKIAGADVEPAQYVGFEKGWGQERYVTYAGGSASDKTTWHEKRTLGGNPDVWAWYFSNLPGKIPTVMLDWDQAAADAFTASGVLPDLSQPEEGGEHEGFN